VTHATSSSDVFIPLYQRSRAAFKNFLCRFLVYALHEPKPVKKPSCGSIPSLNKLQVLILLKKYTVHVHLS